MPGHMPGMGDGGAASDAAPFGAPVDDEHVYSHVLIDQLETRIGDVGEGLRWEGEAWTGTDAWRVVAKSEGERDPDGRVEDGQQELFFAKPLTSFWNLQVGGRYDLDSGPGRGWGAVGIEGLAPGFIRLDATGYAGGNDRFAAKLEASYDQLLTNRLILQPEVEVNFYTRRDPAREVSAGLSDVDAGLRLRYEITRKVAPYIGVTWQHQNGLPGGAGRGEPSGASLAIGLRSWF